MDVMLPDGSVYSSSQLTCPSDLAEQRIYKHMLGVILEVNVSDDAENLSAGVKQDQNGWRHECKVLVVDSNNDGIFDVIQLQSTNPQFEISEVRSRVERSLHLRFLG